MGCLLDFFNIIERLILKLNFSYGIVILPSFCMLVEERGIFITILELETTSLYTPVLLFSSQRFVEVFLQVDLSVVQLRGDRGVLHQQLVVA